MSRFLMLPAVIGVAILGMVLGLWLSGTGGGPGSARVLYVSSSGQLTDSGLTVASLAAKIKSPAAADLGGGKMKLSGQTVSLILKPYAEGQLLVESASTTVSVPQMQLTSAPRMVSQEMKLDPAMLFTAWFNK